MKFLELRIPPPLVGVLIGVAMWLLVEQSWLVGLSGSARLVAAIILVLLGAAVSLAGVVSFRRARTTVNPLKPERTSALVCSGIYRITRNPMYLGMSLISLGIAIWAGSYAMVSTALLASVIIDRLVIVREEYYLEKRFGQSYADYKRQVRRWI